MNDGGFRNYSNRRSPGCYPGLSTGSFFRPCGTGAEVFRSIHHCKRWAMIGRLSGTSAAGTISIVPERGETPEYQEWVWKVMAQSAGNEMVTCVKNANIWVVFRPEADAGRRAEAVELIERLNTQVHSGFRLCVGGTTALTPTLSRSGEGEFSAASVQCRSLGLSCGGHGERGLGGAIAGTLEDKGGARGRVKVGGSQVPRNTAVAMAGMDGTAEGRDPQPKVRRFVSEDIGG